MVILRTLQHTARPDPVLSGPVLSRSLVCLFQPEPQTFTPVKESECCDDVVVNGATGSSCKSARIVLIALPGAA